MFKKNLIAIGLVGIILFVFFIHKSSSPSYEVFGNKVEYDFNKDGKMDSAYIAVDKSEGSGTFYYLTSSIKGTTPFLIGDRIAPQTTEIGADGVVIVNYADRKLEESFVTPPSVAKTLRLVFDPKENVFVDVTNFKLYSNENLGFSLIVPKDFVATESSTTVKFTIPKALSTGTNLSADTYFAVERSAECKDNTLSGAGAGNRYEEKIFAIPNSNPCLVAHYFIHYTVFENYPAGSIKEFDKAALISLFDSIRKTIKI